MCGLIGYFGHNSLGSNNLVSEVLGRMSKAIEARGPDAFGQWVDAESGIALAHRRLAIVDLTPTGTQPMISLSGDFVLVFNGEIYNHLALRKEMSWLSSNCWRGSSDTETLLAGFDHWGVQPTLEKAVGMFAFALWDRKRKVLTIGRDRLGEKPLYYGWQGQGSKAVFLFSSDLAALRQHPAFEAVINRDALSLYMRHNCIGGIYSIYQNIYKLLPGHYLEISRQKPEPFIKQWWSLTDVIEHGVAHPFKGTPDEAVDSLELMLKEAIGQQMITDVPLGAFLSGGVDSSTVVALMQAQSNHPVKTFSIGFNEIGYNEAQHAKAVAKHLGTEHTELYVTSKQARDVIPNLPKIYTEPFADSSQIPIFLLSQLARQHVAVSLSGDAGDELFCGYNRYQMTARLRGKLQHIPNFLQRIASGLISSTSSQTLDTIGRLFNTNRLAEKLQKGALLFEYKNTSALYQAFVSHWHNPDSVVLGGHEPSMTSFWSQLSAPGLNSVEQMMELDLISYLPNDILVKLDRAAMGVSLETRIPMLDHRIVEFAWSLPLNYKLRNGVTKWPLREVLYRHVPRKLIIRPKMGFGVPIDNWLRGPLRDWAETMLDRTRLTQEGFFRHEMIHIKWAEHLSGKRNWQHQLWNVLMFQAWLETR